MATRRVSSDVVAQTLIIAMAVIMPAFGHDDAAFFNYLNNVDASRPLFYYNGYVPIVSGAIAYMLSPLPVLVQAVMYRALPLLLLLLLYRQTKTMLLRHSSGRAVGSSFLAMAAIVLTCVTAPYLAANLTFVHWTMLMCATVAIINLVADRRQPSPAAMIGLLLAAIAFPVGGVLVGLFVWAAVQGASPRRWVLLAAATVAVQMPLLLGAPIPMWNSEVALAPWQFVTHFRDNKTSNEILLVTVALVTLAAVRQWLALRDSGQLSLRSATRLTAIAALVYLGFVTVLAYIVSARFDGHAGLRAHYLIPIVFAAATSSSLLILSERRDERRGLGLGFAAGVTACVAVVYLSTNLRGPLELALMQYRFIAVADEARRGCIANEPYVFASEPWSAVLFCRRLSATEANAKLRHAVPSVGGGVFDERDVERPFVLDPKIVF